MSGKNLRKSTKKSVQKSGSGNDAAKKNRGRVKLALPNELREKIKSEGNPDEVVSEALSAYYSGQNRRNEATVQKEIDNSIIEIQRRHISDLKDQLSVSNKNYEELMKTYQAYMFQVQPLIEASKLKGAAESLPEFSDSENSNSSSAPNENEPILRDNLTPDIPAQHDNFVSDIPAQHDNFVSDIPVQHDNFVSDKPAQHDNFVSDKPAQHDNFVSDKPAQHDNFVSDKPVHHDNFVPVKPAPVAPVEPIAFSQTKAASSSMKYDISFSNEEDYFFQKESAAPPLKSQPVNSDNDAESFFSSQIQKETVREKRKKWYKFWK